MLWAPRTKSLPLIARIPTAGTRPTANPGVGSTVSVTTDDIAAATYKELWSSSDLTDDVYEMIIGCANLAVSGQHRDVLQEIGFDPAGGSTYQHIAYAQAGPAGPYSSRGGVETRLRRFIPAGSSVAVRYSAHWAGGSLSTTRPYGYAYGRPQNATLFRPLRRTEVLGVDIANSRGTQITTVGEASNGAWEYIGQSTIAAEAIEFGFGIYGNALNANVYHIDIALGGPSGAGNDPDTLGGRMLLERGRYSTDAAEAGGKCEQLTEIEVAPAGSYYWMRAQMGPNPLPGGIHSGSIILMGNS